MAGHTDYVYSQLHKHMLQIMVGHLGREALAAAAIGNTWYNLLFYFQLGFTTALDTKASQAFGSGDVGLIISWTAASLILALLLSVPMVSGLLVGAPVAALFFRQSPRVATQVGRFCARLAAGVVPQV
jgi:multidrug resistance protein, MATE family